MQFSPYSSSIPLVFKSKIHPEILGEILGVFPDQGR